MEISNFWAILRIFIGYGLISLVYNINYIELLPNSRHKPLKVTFCDLLKILVQFSSPVHVISALLRHNCMDLKGQARGV